MRKKEIGFMDSGSYKPPRSCKGLHEAQIRKEGFYEVRKDQNTIFAKSGEENKKSQFKERIEFGYKVEENAKVNQIIHFSLFYSLLSPK